MRRLLMLLLLTFPAPALALEQAADGPWTCELDGKPFGAVELAGEGYTFTAAGGTATPGELAAYLDGVTYDVVTGPLADAKIIMLVFHAGDDGPMLSLEGGEPDYPVGLGLCLRP